MRRFRLIVASWLLAIAGVIDILSAALIGTLEELATAIRPRTRKRIQRMKLLPLPGQVDAKP